MKSIFIIPIEPIDARYTKQWFDNIPKLIENHDQNLNVITIAGDDVEDTTTSGAFLNFAATNYYKSTQAAKISQLFMNNQVQDGDKFLITDAWNFAITPIKYMSELLDIKVEIHSIWHAGAYDPSDILGKKMTSDWAHASEKSWFYACDYNYFATEFHKNMFLKNLNIDQNQWHKAVVSGQPHEHFLSLFEFSMENKTNRVMWPHRYNYDKQPEIAEDLGHHMDMMITQKHNFSKETYYDYLASSKVVFSCSLHENLGISLIEGTLAGCIPVVPGRCCYNDIYLPEFIYPSEWTSNWDNYQKNKHQLLDFIQDKVQNYDHYQDLLKQQAEILKHKYINSKKMINNLIR